MKSIIVCWSLTFCLKSKFSSVCKVLTLLVRYSFILNSEQMFNAVWTYFSTEPRVTVCSNTLLHSKHRPASGIRRYFCPHLVHLNDCDENALKFPIISGKIWVVNTMDITSSASTALINLAVLICICSFSSIVLRVEYKLCDSSNIILSVVWVNL